MQVTLTSDSTFKENIWINNAAGSNGAPCGGICLANSNKNRMHKSAFYGNGSVDYTSGNVDFGIGFEGSSSGNVAEERELPVRDHFALEMDHMSGCVMENREPLTPGDEGLRDLKVMMAIYEAARVGKTVKL